MQLQTGERPSGRPRWRPPLLEPGDPNQGKLTGTVSPADPAPLLIVTILGVALVVLLITWLRMPAFIALAVGSLFVGLAARMPLADIPRAFQSGVGDTLGFIAMVIGLGTVIGKLLAESGGAVVVSQALVRALGERRLDWALMFSGFIIGLPVFFQVGLVLLAPVMFTLTPADRDAAAASGHPARGGAFRGARSGAAAPRPAGGHRAAGRRPGPHAALLAHRRPSGRDDRGTAVRRASSAGACTSRRARWRIS